MGPNHEALHVDGGSTGLLQNLGPPNALIGKIFDACFGPPVGQSVGPPPPSARAGGRQSAPLGLPATTKSPYQHSGTHIARNYHVSAEFVSSGS